MTLKQRRQGAWSLPGGLTALGGLTLAAALAVPAGAQVGPAGRRGQPGPGAADLELMAHVLDRITYGRNEASMASIQSLGVDEFIRRQLDPEAVAENPTLTTKLQALPPVFDAQGLGQWDLPDLYSDFLLRAVYSNRQLQEVMAEFWENHFDTLVPAGANMSAERYRNTNWLRIEKQGFRDHALGRFRDLLTVSAKSAAMLYFLDNYLNRAGRGNENYARELLELHTLGVDNGYTQQDVQEVARAFTGWQICSLAATCRLPNPVTTEFFYNSGAHDTNPKTILGVSFPAFRQIEEGEQVLDLLTAHPGTARFICTKLVQKFVADDPPARLVGACGQTFLASSGDIRAVLHTILFSPEFRSPEYRLNKVRTPLEIVLASVRNLEGDTDGNALWGRIAAIGQPLFQNAVPTGYPEAAVDWIGTNSLLQRWKWADQLAFQVRPGTGYSVDPWAIANRVGVRTPDAIVDYFLRLLVRGHHASAAERQVLLDILNRTPFDFNSQATKDNLREVVSIILGFPEYEKQ